MCFTIEPAANRRSLSVQIGADFREEDAQELNAALASADPGTEVDIDFRGVRECEVTALARLAEAARSGHAHVALRGLSEFHLKVLGYLGAPTDVLRGRAAATR